MEFVLDVARRVRIPFGLVVSMISGIALVLDVPPLGGLPSNVLAGGGFLLGTVALGWAIWDQRAEIAAKDALLDDRARVAAALDEFQTRLDEGNDVLRAINRWKPPPSRSSAERDVWAAERIAEYTKAVGDWNTACFETVSGHLTHRRWFMRKPCDYSQVRSSPVPRQVLRLRAEVNQKIDRMDGLQRELQDQSKRAAIS